MQRRTADPARIYVRLFGLAEGIEWGFWLAVTVFWVVELGLGPVQLVAMGAVLEISVLLAETPTGVVADLHSRKRSLVIAQVIMGISYLWAVSSTNYWVILPAQVLFGVGWTFRSGADTAWVTDELKGSGAADDDDIERLLIKKHRASIVFAIASLIFTIGVGTVTSVRWAAATAGFLALGLGALFYRIVPEEHFTPGREQGRGFFETLREGFTVIRSRKRLRVLVSVIVLLDMGSEAFDRLGHKHFLDQGGFGDDSLLGLGVLFLVLAFAGLLVNAGASRALEKGRGVARLAVALLLIATIGGALTAATNLVVVMAIGLMLQDSTREALWPVLEGWANRDAPTEVRATVHSLMGQTTAIGELAGGMLLAIVAEATSIRVVLVLAAIFWFLSAALATRGIERTAPAS